MVEIFKDGKLLRSLEGVVVSAVSEEKPSRRITKLKVAVCNPSMKSPVELILEDAPRIDTAENVRIYYDPATKNGNTYFGDAVEILGDSDKVKCTHLGKYCKVK